MRIRWKGDFTQEKEVLERESENKSGGKALR